MRDALVAAGLAQFLRRGIGAVSVADLLAEADVSRATFYHIFSSKNDILHVIINPILEDMSSALAALESHPSDDVVDGLADVWLAARREHGDGVLLLARLDDPGADAALAARRRAVDDAMLAALGRAERADVLRNGSARYSLRLVAETAVPLLGVYAGHPGAEALFRDALRGLLLKSH